MEEGLDWNQVITESQKEKLILETIVELNQLRESGLLKGLLQETLKVKKTTGNDIDRYFLYISREGRLSEEDHYKTYDEWEQRSSGVKDEEIPKVVEKYRLAPKDIRELRKRLQ